MKRRLHFPLLLVAAFAYGALVVPHAHAGPTAKAPIARLSPPDKPCRFENRLDIEIIEGVWFECSCERLMVGTVCDWYEITSSAEDPQHKTKRTKTHRAWHITAPALSRVIA